MGGDGRTISGILIAGHTSGKSSSKERSTPFGEGHHLGKPPEFVGKADFLAWISSLKIFSIKLWAHGRMHRTLPVRFIAYPLTAA